MKKFPNLPLPRVNTVVSFCAAYVDMLKRSTCVTWYLQNIYKGFIDLVQLWSAINAEKENLEGKHLAHKLNAHHQNLQSKKT